MPKLADLFTRFVHSREESAEPVEPVSVVCPDCKTDLTFNEIFLQTRVCPTCRRHFSIPARQRIDLIADPDSFKEAHRGLKSRDPLLFIDSLPYRSRLKDAQKHTGLSEAIVIGRCRIGGKPVVLGVMDFDFLGGSMGSVVGEKVARAFELGIKNKLPVIMTINTGGARMQEGMLSLVQMAKTVAVARKHSEAGMPYIVVLCDPTMGGVYASFANQADVIIAEPNALIGFAGPRVIEQTMGQRLPKEAQHAEFQLEHGQIDLIVDRARHRAALSNLLDLLFSPYKLSLYGRDELPVVGERHPGPAWAGVQLARSDRRPTALDYISRITNGFVELHGDRLYGDDPAVLGGLAELAGEPVVIVGQERGHEGDVDRHGGRPKPEGYRKAKRLMKLAAKLRLPLITLIDTPGAYPGLESEERGLAGALSDCLATMSILPTPVISVIIGEGGSGGALALGVGDRVLMQENAIYSVIAPEGAAAILYRDASRAPELAEALRCTAHDCLDLGVVDALVPEPSGGAQTDFEASARMLKNAIVHEMVQLQRISVHRLLSDRYRKFRRMGELGERVHDTAADKGWFQNLLKTDEILRQLTQAPLLPEPKAVPAPDLPQTATKDDEKTLAG